MKKTQCEEFFIFKDLLEFEGGDVSKFGCPVKNG